jgi:hypothetical protein
VLPAGLFDVLPFKHMLSCGHLASAFNGPGSRGFMCSPQTFVLRMNGSVRSICGLRASETRSSGVMKTCIVSALAQSSTPPASKRKVFYPCVRNICHPCLGLDSSSTVHEACGADGAGQPRWRKKRSNAAIVGSSRDRLGTQTVPYSCLVRISPLYGWREKPPIGLRHEWVA